jgi:hypothetical protein
VVLKKDVSYTETRMKAYFYGGVQGSLRLERKTGWKSGKTGPALFVHGGPMEPSVVQSTGLTPSKSSEYLVDQDNNRISGGRMLFAFKVSDNLVLPATPEKPKGVDRLWGLDGHMYVFKVPAQTNFWSQGGVINDTAEVAFEYEFDTSDIVAYWAPSKNYVLPVGQAPNPRKNFQAVSWQQYLVSRGNA